MTALRGRCFFQSQGGLAISLQLYYHDKYRLWVDLVRGKNQSLFVAGDSTCALGEPVEIQVRCTQDSTRLTVRGTVVGQRTGGDRFRAGLFVALHHSELARCADILQLGTLQDLQKSSSSNFRVQYNIPVRMTRPLLSSYLTTHNISESGLLLLGASLTPGKQVSMVLHFDDSPVEATAEVIWANPERDMLGMRFVQASENSQAIVQRVQDLIQQHHSSQDANRRVIVADTDDELMILLTSAFDDPNCQIIQANNTQHALDLVKTPPSLVVLDMLNPQFDGATICKTIRSTKKIATTPIVVVSPLAAPMLQQVAKSCAASAFLSKPFLLSDLFGLLSRF